MTLPTESLTLTILVTTMPLHVRELLLLRPPSLTPQLSLEDLHPIKQLLQVTSLPLTPLQVPLVDTCKALRQLRATLRPHTIMLWVLLVQLCRAIWPQLKQKFQMPLTPILRPIPPMPVLTLSIPASLMQSMPCLLMSMSFRQQSTQLLLEENKLRILKQPQSQQYKPVLWQELKLPTLQLKLHWLML